MNTEIFDLGKIGITLGYEYDDKVIYEKLTIVLYKGKSYISTKTTKGVSPEQDIKTWQLVAEAKDAYHMLVDAGKITLTEEEFLEQLVDATKGRYIVQGNIINAADEEDLSVEHSDLLGIDTLKLANRDNTNGMGYVILRKNKSFAEQVTKENTIYEIRYDFNLFDGEITIPKNCILKFEGGKLLNGIILGNKSIIRANATFIFSNVSIKGTWINEYSYPEWFGAKGDLVNNDRIAIQTALDSPFYKIVFNKNGYLIDGYYKPEVKVGLNISKAKYLEGKKIDATQDGSTTFLASKNSEYDFLVMLSSSDIILKGIRFEGNRNVETIDDYEDWEHNNITKTIFNSYNVSTIIGVNPDISYINSLHFERIDCAFAKEYGISLRCWGSKFYSCNCAYIGNSSLSSAFMFSGTKDNCHDTSLNIERCYAQKCRGSAFILKNITYSNMLNCASDENGFDYNAKTVELRQQDLQYNYKFTDCIGINILGCGLERGPRSIFIDKSYGINISGGSYDVYLRRFFNVPYDTFNFYVSNSKGIDINTSYFCHDADEKQTLFRIVNSDVSIRKCLIKWVSWNPISVSAINISDTGNSFIIDNNYRANIWNVTDDELLYLVKPGLHFLNNVSGITEDSFTGMMEVTVSKRDLDTAVVKQQITTTDYLYFRSNSVYKDTDGVYKIYKTAWNKISIKDMVNAVAIKAFVPEGTNIDNLTETGVYRITGEFNNFAGTFPNSGEIILFKGILSIVTNSIYCVQTYYHSSNSIVFYRIRNSNGISWGKWVRGDCFGAITIEELRDKLKEIW